MSVKQNLLLSVLMLYFITEITSKFEFTNFKCKCVDGDYCTIEYCYLKSINRTYKYASGRLHLLKPPLTNVKLNCALYKRLSGYKPFLYNFTVDGCKFMNNPRQSPIANYFFGLIGTKHNLNQSCPFNGDMYIDEVPISLVNSHLTATLPFPEGDYLFQTHGIVDGAIRTVLQIYGTLS